MGCAVQEGSKRDLQAGGEAVAFLLHCDSGGADENWAAGTLPAIVPVLQRIALRIGLAARNTQVSTAFLSVLMLVLAQSDALLGKSLLA